MSLSYAIVVSPSYTVEISENGVSRNSISENGVSVLRCIGLSCQ